jgi:hypothetical protein
MTIDSSGNVGIGTSSPSKKFHISNGATSITEMIIGSSGTGGDSSSRILLNEGEIGVSDSLKYGFSLAYAGTANFGLPANTFGLLRHTNLEIGSPVLVAQRDTGNIGIATTTPAYKLDVNSTAQFTNTVIVGTPTADTHAATKSYVDSAFISPTISGDLNMGGNNILAVNKLTVNTIDPLYDINNVLYSSYATSMIGGVKEEYIGKTKINRYNSSVDEYEKVIDFSDEREGTELWLWYKTVDFNEDNVDVFITPSGSMAKVYYKVMDDSIILRSDRSVTVSYRLIGRRFDWQSWPTIAKDQSQKAGLIIK